MSASVAIPMTDTAAEQDTGRLPPPPAPRRLADTGLSEGFVCDLILRCLHAHGDLLGAELARTVCLPFATLVDLLQYLKDRLMVEVTGGDVVGPVSYRYTLSDRGRQRARELMQACAYVGPAPVTLEAYSERARQQRVGGALCTTERLQNAFDGLVIRPELLEELGPAICSGRSIFVYGPPGNGKTSIAKGLGRYLNAGGGDMYLPHAILVESSIVVVFDPSIHEPVGQAPRRIGLNEPDALDRLLRDDSDRVDQRWLRIRRPVVVTGGELTLEMLELQHNAASNYYQAPLHIKANGGVFLIDDFGRQLVSPKDLLNRWILPLEERHDFLTLHTGRKFSVPFEQLIIFSTNLEPRELVDDAFLRRMRHKIKIDAPDRRLYEEILDLVCRARDVPLDPGVVDYLFKTHYEPAGRVPRCSDPRDIVDILEAVCQFRGLPRRLESPSLEMTCDRFFGEL